MNTINLETHPLDHPYEAGVKNGYKNGHAMGYRAGLEAAANECQRLFLPDCPLATTAEDCTLAISKLMEPKP